ncbi:MAG: ABC transporter ATP-binding protein [Gaiellaceae bacterium]|nr:ABC transporter ATP-binding protein [Gaiellaceae bacterium]
MTAVARVQRPEHEEVVRVERLRVELANGTSIVEDVSLAVAAGEILGLVGESGSGKTTLALALLGYARPGCRIAGGEVVVAGLPLTGVSEDEARGRRGRVVAYVPQDPSAALNPSLRVGDTIADLLRAHASRAQRSSPEVLRTLERVDLPGEPAFAERFPHELSGGQQQRVAIAAALACEPAAVVMDEPTTGLDVVTQARILEEVERLRRERGLAVVYVSHDLAVVATIADRIAVMYAGRIVEEGPTAELLSRPRHPYTLGLVSSIPDHVTRRAVTGIPGVAPGPDERPAGCAFAPRCAQRVERCEGELPALEPAGAGHVVRCFEWRRTPGLVSRPLHPFPLTDAATPLLEVEGLRAAHGRVVVVDDVSFALGVGECLALVGESGSGKTTIARCVVGLHPPSVGRVLLEGAPLAPRARARTREERRRLQIVFQNPDSALNRRHSVRRILLRALRKLAGLTGRAAEERVRDLASRVRLTERTLTQKPVQLSGGLKQRVAIARAFAGDPQLVVCDEPTSALDVSVQAAILNLLVELQAEKRVAYLFISHDLGVVRYISDRIAVLYLGRLQEVGPADVVFEGPHHPYTEALLSAVPTIDGGGRERIKLEGEIPSASSPPTGCVFHTRCPRKLGSVCEEREPSLVEVEEGHLLRCHIPIEELRRLQGKERATA